MFSQTRGDRKAPPVTFRLPEVGGGDSDSAVVIEIIAAAIDKPN